ncbi:MAG TPA: PepSY domain-containing protein [Nitrospira sp.]|nr:PepSY domain-containing protein [Nitrospira sp.]
MGRTGFLVVLATASVFMGGTAWAKADTKQKLALSQHATVTVEQAIRSATERVPGKVVEAELEKKRDKAVWEVEIATADNKIMEVHVDSMSGTILHIEEQGAPIGKKK